MAIPYTTLDETLNPCLSEVDKYAVHMGRQSTEQFEPLVNNEQGGSQRCIVEHIEWLIGLARFNQ